MSDIVFDSMMKYAEKKEAALVEELARLGREGHLLIKEVQPRTDLYGNILTLSGALRVVMPKCDEQVLENAKLQSLLDSAKGKLKEMDRKLARYELKDLCFCRPLHPFSACEVHGINGPTEKAKAIIYRIESK